MSAAAGSHPQARPRGLGLIALCGALWTQPVHAGSGPWALGHTDYSLYLGAEAQRFDTLAISSGSGADGAIDVAGGVATVGLKGILSYGLLPRLEAEALVPWYRVHQNRPGESPCPDLGAGTCATTSGLGIVRLRVKGVVLDEILGAPLSLAVGPELRLGQHTAAERRRITNLGEGTLDAGGFLSVGRTGTLGAGYWAGYLEGVGRYRTPNTSLSGSRVPGPEAGLEAEALFAPSYDVAVGPSLSWGSRLGGVDFEEADLADRDRFSSLRYTAVQGGAKVVVRSGEELTLSGGVLRTLWAVNNPSDVWTVSVGVSARGFLQRGGTD